MTDEELRQCREEDQRQHAEEWQCYLGFMEESLAINRKQLEQTERIIKLLREIALNQRANTQ